LGSQSTVRATPLMLYAIDVTQNPLPGQRSMPPRTIQVVYRPQVADF